jgi:hypothetical protein
MIAARRLGRAFIVATYVAPWAWLACFAIFVAAVTFKVGHFPRYSNPDPKHVEGLCTLYMLTVVLLLATLLSPFLVGMYAVIAWLRRQGDGAEPRPIAFYLLGISLAGMVIFVDAFGLGTWLFD